MKKYTLTPLQLEMLFASVDGGYAYSVVHYKPEEPQYNDLIAQGLVEPFTIKERNFCFAEYVRATKKGADVAAYLKEQAQPITFEFMTITELCVCDQCGHERFEDQDPQDRRCSLHAHPEYSCDGIVRPLYSTGYNESK